MNKSYVKDGVLYKYEKESGKLRLSGGSWTINLDIINLDEIHRFSYITGDYIYEIQKDDALSGGFFRKFRGENKLVVPISKWKKRSK